MADNLLIRLGARVRKLRKKQGWTQVVMAEKIGLDRAFISDLENGKRNISILNLSLIAKGLEKTLSQLLSGI